MTKPALKRLKSKWEGSRIGFGHMESLQTPQAVQRLGGFGAATFAAAAAALAKLEEEEPIVATFTAALGPSPEDRDEAAVKKVYDWWLQFLPRAGIQLAQELECAVASGALFEAFKRGRYLSGLMKGAKLLEEGVEARHYYIIVTGACQLRCRAPRGARRANVASSSDGSASSDDDEAEASKGAAGKAAAEKLSDASLAPCGTVTCGEALAVFPGDHRAPYDVQCTERTSVLMLNALEYEVTLKAHHKKLFAEVVDFLQTTKMAQATPYQLLRLAPCVRQTRVPRGRTVMKAGDSQRHVWFLRKGTCSVYESEDGTADVLAKTLIRGEEEADERPAAEEAPAIVGSGEDEEGARARQIERVKVLSNLAPQPRLTAAVGERRRALAKFARGKLRSSLASSGNPSQTQPVLHRQQPIGATASVVATSSGAAALVSQPGTIFGEEFLLYDQCDLVHARYCSTVRADSDCVFLVVDFAFFRQLAHCFPPAGAETVARCTAEKVSRRTAQHGRAKEAVRTLEQRARWLQRQEHEAAERQQVRLPPSAGYQGVSEINDLDDWLLVVSKHRRAPRNEKSLPTLLALEGSGYGPNCPNNGPGVAAMLKIVSDQPPHLSSKAYCEALQKVRQQRRPGQAKRTHSAPAPNPIGADVSSATQECYAKADVPEPQAATLKALEAGDLIRLESGTLEAPPDAAPPEPGTSIFFQTELDPDAPSAPSTAPGGPRRRPSSVPVLPRVSDKDLSGGNRPVTSPADAAAGGREGAAQARASRDLQVQKGLRRALPGKSLLIFVSDKEARKALMKSLLGIEVPLCFVRTGAELIQRISDPKDQFSTLILDLEKDELKEEALLRSIRDRERYATVPIIVLSAVGRQLSDVVRRSCAFVVFHPVAAFMLRESLLWCLNLPQQKPSETRRRSSESGAPRPRAGDRAPEEAEAAQGVMGALKVAWCGS